MVSVHKIYYNILLIVIFFLLTNCQLQKTTKNHGILFLENRYNQLQVNITNMNDVLKSVGTPHTKSISDKKT